MKIMRILPLSGTPMKGSMSISIVHELTFFVKDEDSHEDRFIRRDAKFMKSGSSD